MAVRQTLDLRPVTDIILLRATEGLNQAIGYCERRALLYVPVRNVFGGGSRHAKTPGLVLSRTSTSDDVYKAFRHKPFTAKRSEAFSKSRPLRLNQRRAKDFGVVRFTLGAGGKMIRDDSGRQLSYRGEQEVERGKKDIAALQRQTALNNSLSDTLQPEAGHVSGGRAKASPLIAVEHTDERAVFQIGGRLKRSIRADLAEMSRSRKIMGRVIAGGPEAPYARFQEFGTRHNVAHPFLRPALYDTRRVIVMYVSRAIAGRGWRTSAS